MKPFIDQAFWSDPEIENSPADVKLCALWLITNSNTSLIGLCGVSEVRFAFETGLPREALAKTVETLPSSFVRVGNIVFVKNYVRHQFGQGEKLQRNNFFSALTSLCLAVKDQILISEIAAQYPEFQEALRRASEGLAKPKGRIGKDREGQERNGLQGSAEGISGTTTNLPFETSLPTLEPENESNEPLDGKALDFGASGEPIKTPAFAKFWSAYPKKAGKGDAERAWKRRKCGPLLPAILHGLELAKASDQWRKDCGQFIPHPATWINREGWLDDPSTWTNLGAGMAKAKGGAGLGHAVPIYIPSETEEEP